MLARNPTVSFAGRSGTAYFYRKCRCILQKSSEMRVNYKRKGEKEWIASHKISPWLTSTIEQNSTRAAPLHELNPRHGYFTGSNSNETKAKQAVQAHPPPNPQTTACWAEMETSPVSALARLGSGTAEQGSKTSLILNSLGPAQSSNSDMRHR